MAEQAWQNAVSRMDRAVGDGLERQGVRAGRSLAVDTRIQVVLDSHERPMHTPAAQLRKRSTPAIGICGVAGGVRRMTVGKTPTVEPESVDGNVGELH